MAEAHGYVPPGSKSSHIVDVSFAHGDDLLGLESWPSYCAEFRKALSEDFADVADLGVIRRAGVDRQGNPLYLVVPGNARADSDPAKIRRYAFKLMHVHAREGSPYSLVFLQNNVNRDARELTAWFVIDTYRMVPRGFKKNLKIVSVVHPTGFVRACLMLLSPFLSNSFYDKLFLTERVEFLDDIVGGGKESIEALAIPAAYYEFDKDLDARAAEEEETLRSGAAFQGAMGVGAAFQAIGTR